MLLSDLPELPQALRITISLSLTSFLFMGATALLWRYATGRITEERPYWLIATFVLSLVLLFFNLHIGVGLSANVSVMLVCLYNIVAVALTHQSVKRNS